MTLDAFLKQYLRDEEVGHFASKFSAKKTIPKKSLLIRPGENCNYLAFIKSGLFRVYLINEAGIETTVWFSFQGMMISDMLGFYSEKPSSFFIQAIENSEVNIIHKSQLLELYDEYPAYREFGRKYAENALIKVMQRMLILQTKSAEERYKLLLTQQQFMQKIPLKYLATYLGITDTSLSRIRKQVT